jgi:hypothetical protein
MVKIAITPTGCILVKFKGWKLDLNLHWLVTHHNIVVVTVGASTRIKFLHKILRF